MTVVVLSPILGIPLPYDKASLDVWLRIIDWRIDGYLVTTTSTPPGSPTAGRGWQIGAAPTGAWDPNTNDEHAFKIAIARDTSGSSWDFIPVVIGLGPIWHDDNVETGAPGWLGYDGSSWADKFAVT